MKIRLYRILFRIFSFLSDKTDGALFFSKYKLFLGTIIIGLTTSSCGNKPSRPVCYSVAVRKVNEEPIQKISSNIDSLSNTSNPLELNRNTLENGLEIRPRIMCYSVSLPVVDLNPVDTIPQFQYGIVDMSPEFEGGNVVKFTQWVQARLQYPSELKREKVKGEIMLTFRVSASGYIENATIIKGLHPLLDAEVIRVVLLSPQWKPGKHNEELINTLVSIQVTFEP